MIFGIAFSNNDDKKAAADYYKDAGYQVDSIIEYKNYSDITSITGAGDLVLVKEMAVLAGNPHLLKELGELVSLKSIDVIVVDGGIKFTKAKRAHAGKPAIKLSDEQIRIMKKYKSGLITSKEAMESAGIGKTTFFSLMKSI